MYVNKSFNIFSVSPRLNLPSNEKVRSPWRLLSGHERQLSSPADFLNGGVFFSIRTPKMTEARLVEALADAANDAPGNNGWLAEA
jgi:hypothetical protein